MNEQPQPTREQLQARVFSDLIGRHVGAEGVGYRDPDVVIAWADVLAEAVATRLMPDGTQEPNQG